MFSARNIDRRLVFAAFIALGLEIGLLMSDVHFIWSPIESVAPRLKVAAVSGVAGRVKFRSPVQLNWFEVSEGQELQEGDEVATLENSQATLQLVDRQTITLGSNSMLVLRRSKILSGTKFTLTLIRGSLEQQKSSESPRLAHQVQIEVSGQKILTNDSIAQATPPIPAMLPPIFPIESPKSGRYINQKSILFHWGNRPQASADYTTSVEIARNSDFKNLIASHNVTNQNSFEYHPINKGTFYWRLVNKNATGRSVSEAGTFEVVNSLTKPLLARPRIEEQPTTESVQKKLGAPQLFKPSIRYEGTTLTMYFLNLAWNAIFPSAYASEPVNDPKSSRYTIHLAWREVDGANAYVLQIATDPEFQHKLSEKYLNSPQYAWHSEIAGFYYWRVAAIDGDGDRGPFSEFMTINIKAQLNKPGDDSSYESYLRFDDYAGHENKFRLITGPEFQNYKFTPGNNGLSPGSVRYTTWTFLNLQLEYEHRLTSYYSLRVMLRTASKNLSASNFEDRAGQHRLRQDETILGAGVDRRFFFPRYYLNLQMGFRASFIDIPIRESDTQLALSTFSFVGLYAMGGYHHALSKKTDAYGTLGGSFQYTDASIRYGGAIGFGFSYAVSEILSLGMRVDSELRLYNFGADNISGTARNLSIRPMGTLEFTF